MNERENLWTTLKFSLLKPVMTTKNFTFREGSDGVIHSNLFNQPPTKEEKNKDEILFEPKINILVNIHAYITKYNYVFLDCPVYENRQKIKRLIESSESFSKKWKVKSVCHPSVKNPVGYDNSVYICIHCHKGSPASFCKSSHYEYGSGPDESDTQCPHCGESTSHSGDDDSSHFFPGNNAIFIHQLISNRWSSGPFLYAPKPGSFLTRLIKCGQQDKHLKNWNDFTTTCAVCHTLTFLKCGKCKGRFYCGKKCQVLDWVKHKKLCRKHGVS